MQLLLFELPQAETILSRFRRPTPKSYRYTMQSGKKEEESASSSSILPPAALKTHRQVPLAFDVPPNPRSHLGVEQKLASISLFEEDMGLMEVDLH